MTHPTQTQPSEATQTTQTPAVSASMVLIAGLRDLLADCYGEQIAAIAPLACDALNAEYSACEDLAHKGVLRGAFRILSKRVQPLRTEVARELRERFDAKLTAPADALSHTGRFSLEALKLMENLGMQEEYEVEHAVEQLKAACQDELIQLGDALAKLTGRTALSESHNPVFPRVFARALIDALAAAGCEAQVKRAAFRALIPFLAQVIPHLYDQGSAMLTLGGRRLSGEFKVPSSAAEKAEVSYA